MQNRIDDIAKSYLGIREHNEFKTRYENDVNGVRDELRRAEKDIAFLRDNQVSRQEHITHWDEEKDKVGNLRSEVESLRRDFGGQYTIGKKIDDLQAQVDALRAIRNSGSGLPLLAH